jgi:hypothetical protein
METLVRAEAVVEKLLGAWDVVSCFETRRDGGIDFPLGADAVGKLIYTADGHVSAQLFRRDAKRFHDEDSRNASEAESAAVWKDYFGYFGTFSVDVQAQTIIHHIEGASFPNLVGTDQVRRYRLEGEQLILDADTAWGNVQAVWRRSAT